jgi:hypothetical protein
MRKIRERIRHRKLETARERLKNMGRVTYGGPEPGASRKRERRCSNHIQSKLDPYQGGQGEMKPKVTGAHGAECFKCRRMVHFNSVCTFELLCVLCKKQDRASAKCMARGESQKL